MSKPQLSQDYADFPKSFFSEVDPEPQENARLLVKNEALMAQIGCHLSDAELLDLASGQLQQVECHPIAQKYVGHQFGYYNPDLGDGRGLLLGQWRDQKHQAWDFHLKGAGRTPYSRQGDGRAVLRSTIREFLASEALYGLGVPTTRALVIAASDEPVSRETIETRASLIRVTPTHIRFGHFQWAAMKGPTHLELLVQFVVNKHFPQWSDVSLNEQAANLFNYACQATASLLAQWQAVGFNHGVMNTDNMSILGETFDFGPFAFFDDFRSDFVCNHSDYEGRYGYNQQANIALWNCKVLATALSGLIDEQQVETALEGFVQTYNQNYLQQMVERLGLSQVQPQDKELIGGLLTLMDKYSVDYHLFFRRLSCWQTNKENDLMGLLTRPGAFSDWFTAFEKRLTAEKIADSDWRQAIQQANPSIVLRNYIAQEIIEAAQQGNTEPLHTWMQALQSPFEDHPELAAYQQPPESHQKGFALSCSS